MMDMAADNAVVPEEAVQIRGPIPTTAQHGDAWAEVKPSTTSNAVSPGLQRAPSKTPSGVRLAMRRVSALFNPNGEPMDPDRRKSHYRRGSILIKHLENKKATGKATEKDMKFFEMVKSQFDNNIMESRTIISLSVFQTGSNPLQDPFAVIHMPIEIQQGFRRKLFAIFSIQLLAVVVLICLFSYLPFIVDAFEPAFQQWPYVFGSFVVMVLSLLWLYLVKYKFPINFFVLGLYTVTQSIFFAGCDYLFNTRASIFIFSFLFCVMSITTLLCTKISKRSSEESTPSVLISYPVVLLVAFFIAFIGSLIIYFVYMEEVVSALQYSASLAAMLLLVLWFAYDASCMNERLSPDEYMQGMVFFYTDMVLFLVFLSIILVACFACEGDCACYGTADIAPIGTGGGGGGDDEDGEMLDEEGGAEEGGQ